MLDLDELLQSFGDETPSGTDLEYEPEYTELTLANQPGEERVLGDSVIPAEGPDYDEVEKVATSLLGRTRDLRVAVMLANASLHTGGLPVFENVLRYIRRSLEEYWDSVHPQLDEEDDNDPTMRVNAVSGLADREIILTSLRNAVLTDSRAFGRFSLRDLLVAEGEISPAANMEDVPTPQIVSAAFQDTDAVRIKETIDAVDACLDHVKAISAVFDEQIGSLGPDLDPLQSMILEIKRRIGRYADIEATESAGEPGSESDIPSSVAAGAIGSTTGTGAIHSPEDVKKAIDRIVEYYARHEPSSPVPLLLNRARRLISADFFTIMRDMAPQGVENVALIGGIEENDD